MARIRTVKPEFWEDETIGLLSPYARLLFIATWNLADDEGLLRWSAPYIKAAVFMYDTLSVEQVKDVMGELVTQGLVFPYRAGRSRQELAFIVKFRRHQKINRPQPGKLPPPPIQNSDVWFMYAERDGWVCHLCGEGIVHEIKDERLNLSLDHLTPRSKGGTDYPSNLAASHVRCNKARGNRPVPEASPHAVNDSVNGSVSDSPLEGKGRDQGKDSALRVETRNSAVDRGRALAVVEAKRPLPAAETAQTVLAAYIDWRRQQGINGFDGRTKGQIARHLRQAFDGGHQVEAIKLGLRDWHYSDQHPSTLPSFIDSAARGGQPRASPGKAQRQLNDMQRTYEQMQAMRPPEGPEGGGNGDLGRLDRHRGQAQRELP